MGELQLGDDIEDFTLPAGTLCKRGGLPFVLKEATVIRCHPDNWPTIRDGFYPAVALVGSDDQPPTNRSL